MLNRDGFMRNGCMMEVSNEAMKHPEWKILNKYRFICNKDWVNNGERPEKIIRSFIGEDIDINSIRAFTANEINPIRFTRRLVHIDCLRAIKSAYDVCIDGFSPLDYVDVHEVGPYQCLQFWHFTKNGRKLWTMEVVRDNRNGKIKGYICH